MGCRRKAPKSELLRIAADKNGWVRADPGGKLGGRGAYVCRRIECLKSARKRLPRALRCDAESVAAAWSAIEAEVTSG